MVRIRKAVCLAEMIPQTIDNKQRIVAKKIGQLTSGSVRDYALTVNIVSEMIDGSV